MQVSIYLKPDLVKKLDHKIKQTNKSRSEFIKSLLQDILLAHTTHLSIYDEAFATMRKDTTHKLLNTINRSRKNSNRFK